MREAVARLLSFAVVLLCQTAGSQEPTPPTRLVLVATGPNTATTERYLGLLCRLLQDEKGTSRYRQVTIYRAAEATEIVAQKLFADPVTRETLDRKALEDFSQALVRGGQYCAGDLAPTRDEESTASDVVQVEWMQEGTFRVQKAIIPRGRGRPSLAFASYVDIQKDLHSTARAIGVASLGMDLSTIIEVDSPAWTSPPWATCEVGFPDCVLVGMDVTVSVPLRDNYWVKAHEVEMEIHHRCSGDDSRGPEKPSLWLEPGKSQTTEIDGGQMRTFVFQTALPGICLLTVHASYRGSAVDVPVTPGIHIRPGSVSTTGPAGIPIEGRDLIGIKRLPLAPGWAPEARLIDTHARASGDFLIPGTEVVAWGKRMKDALEKLPFDTAPSASSLYSAKLESFLARRGDRLGYEIIYQPGDPICEQAARAAFASNEFALSWTNRCAALLDKGKGELLTRNGEAHDLRLAKYLVRPVDDSRVTAVPGLRDAPFVEWTRYPGPIRMPVGERESYWVTAVSTVNELTDPNSVGKTRLEQSYPRQLLVVRLGVARPPLGVDIHAGWMLGYVHTSERRLFATGPSLALESAILENTFAIAVAASVPQSSDENGKVLNTTYRVGVELNVRLVTWWRMLLGRLGGEYRDANYVERNLLLDYGTGYMFGQGYAYTAARLGWTWSGFPRPFGTAASLVRPFTRNGDSTMGVFSVMFPL